MLYFKVVLRQGAINIPDNNTLVTIPESTLKNSGITSITIPTKITTVDNSSFGCTQ